MGEINNHSRNTPAKIRVLTTKEGILLILCKIRVLTTKEGIPLILYQKAQDVIRLVSLEAILNQDIHNKEESHHNLMDLRSKAAILNKEAIHNKEDTFKDYHNLGNMFQIKVHHHQLALILVTLMQVKPHIKVDTLLKAPWGILPIRRHFHSKRVVIHHKDTSLLEQIIQECHKRIVKEDSMDHRCSALRRCAHPQILTPTRMLRLCGRR